ncbi:Uncharacterised protein [Mycobacteroides abscessus subsp. abscessus]|nr:hypothetical protein [Mycobacteroides abscessus]QST89534.1 hypothetical protein PROPHIGD36-2_9 [Mycobacterium phage prophiGD36-2]SHY59683.1 Uncharacterised protein [Mycobacteroides abscessus subsp. abscessus]SIA44784.1 Uncharacterised protein [Mycobacteroides abscessus subsp. abscessus]SIA76376.1 Uncharacterised protein [Mycobacteroides abscessus subsp. abscessus]SIA89813.1 Uncharacterised protein [Mycobacteroides abscessus subsp. abscessus]
MPEPTRALLEMVAEVADELQDITAQIEPASPTYCSGRAWSPDGLRGYVTRWTAVLDERDALKRALTETLWELPAGATPDYAAAAILHHFDVKPKGGKP